MDDWASKNYEDLTNIERAEFHLSFDQYPMVQAFTAIAIARAAERQAAAMERIAAVLEHGPCFDPDAFDLINPESGDTKLP